MTALPPVSEAAKLLPSGSSNLLSIYDTVVLPAERDALDSKAPDSEASLLAARVMGFFLLYPPSTAAQRTLVEELSFCNREDDPSQAVYQLGQMYIRHLILIFKQSRGKTPMPSSHASQSSFERLMRGCEDNFQRAQRDRSSAKAAALLRDNYRCMITGRYEHAAVDAGLVHNIEEGASLGATHCCHIFPDSLGHIHPGASGAKESEVASVWAILDRFGYKDICEEIGIASSGARLHRLENIMTLDALVHTRFDDMKLWLEVVPDQMHCYDVCHPPRTAPLIVNTLPRRVQLVSHRADLPLPNPRYLHIHATCCRVAHMSGAAEYLDRVLRDMAEARVLAEDGGDAEKLSVLLHNRLPNAV
ncbi:hypothetical protein OH77DRAFT_1426783 [Trametes cingulata]|nr:hypothetical protein OH77DRAFT_1426783 [Trametes cingulata]